MRQRFELAIVGGGIVGLAVAREVLKRLPQLKVVVLEKEARLAEHQTGHNSGVIHAGIYYAPGSLKAKLCVKGMQMIYDYCDEQRIPYKRVGKLIVATNDEEVKRVRNLYERSLQNQVKGVRLIESQKGITEIEPHCVGKMALHSPNTGIVNFQLISEHYARDILARGGSVISGFEADQFAASSNPEYPIMVRPSKKIVGPAKVSGSLSSIYDKITKGNPDMTIECKYVVTCAGLHSDRVAVKTGCKRDPIIVPVRGDYLLLKPERAHLIRGNIYPAPDPRFPFLGVHFTPRMNGEVWLGPNAIVALDREGYTPTSFRMADAMDTVTSAGFLRLATRFTGFGVGEMYRAINLRAQVKILQRYIPSITLNDIQRGPAGVRAQALSSDGSLVDDFVFDLASSSAFGRRMLHVRNAPSPAATSSLAIAEMAVDRIQKEFSL